MINNQYLSPNQENKLTEKRLTPYPIASRLSVTELGGRLIDVPFVNFYRDKQTVIGEAVKTEVSVGEVAHDPKSLDQPTDPSVNALQYQALDSEPQITPAAEGEVLDSQEERARQAREILESM